MVLLLIAFVGAAVIALVLWRALNNGAGLERTTSRRPSGQSAAPSVSGPDDDPEFLRQLDEHVRRRDEPPPPA